MLVKKIRKIKIVVLPFFPEHPLSSERLAPAIPPLYMVSVSTALRKAGFYVEQDDLNIKLHTYNLSRRFVDLEKFLNAKRIINFVEHNNDDYIRKNVIKILQLTKWDNFDAYLFSCQLQQNISSISILLSVVKVLREYYKDELFVAGGRFASYVDEEFFNLVIRYRLLNYIIQGPGERSIVKLINYLNNFLEGERDEKKIETIPGLFYIQNSKVKKNKNDSPPIPFCPDFDGLPMNLYYLNCKAKYAKRYLKEDRNVLILPYKFTNGCPYRCAFCFTPFLDKFSFKNPQEIVEDISYLKQKWQTKYFYFLEDTFNFSISFCKELCRLIIDSNLNIFWSCCVHPANLTDELIYLMQKAGCKRIIYGFETASEKLQKYINKNIDVNQLSKHLKLANDLNIWNGIEIICGLPYEQQEDVIATISFLRQNKNYIDEYYINPFQLVSNSSFLKNPTKYGLGNIQRYNFSNAQQSIWSYPAKHRLVGYSFDELHGLNWRKKQKQIINSFNKIINAISFRLLPSYESISYLFYFYDCLESDKRKIKKIYNIYSVKMMRKAFFRSSYYVYNELAKICNLPYFINRFFYFLGK